MADAGSLAKEVWHERVRRATLKRGDATSTRLAHRALAILSNQDQFLVETWTKRTDDGVGRPMARWEPNPFYGADEETREQAVQAVFDELYEYLGVGPCPH